MLHSLQGLSSHPRSDKNASLSKSNKYCSVTLLLSLRSPPHITKAKFTCNLLIVLTCIISYTKCFNPAIQGTKSCSSHNLNIISGNSLCVAFFCSDPVPYLLLMQSRRSALITISSLSSCSTPISNASRALVATFAVAMVVNLSCNAGSLGSPG